MESYTNIASVYDKLINQDYVNMADKIESIFEKYNAKPKLVLDLACGTGNLTHELDSRGYDMIGIDLSEDMLSVAYGKNNPNIRFLCQDMTDFELYGTVDAIVCTLDSINYITNKRDLNRMFKLVNNYLNPNGLFIFDINTPYKLKHVLGDNTFVIDEENVFYTWENFYDKKTNLSHQFLNFFVENNDNYTRFTEQHVQRAYEIEELKKLLEKNNMSILEKTRWWDKRINKNSEKIVIVARDNNS